MATVKRSRNQSFSSSSRTGNRCYAGLRHTLLASAPVAAALWAGQAWGATDTWVGLGVDNNWKDPANWAGSIVPSAGDVLAFDGANRFSPNNNFAAGTVFDGFVFDSTAAGPFSLAGNSVQLAGNITDNTQSFTHTINLPITLDATPTINVTQNGSLLMNGVISGGFGLNETGLGLLTLSGTNSFTGPVTIGNGATLAFTADLNLGAAPTSATPGDLVLDGGSLLNISGANFTLNANRGISIVNAGGATPPAASISIATGQGVIYDGVIADGGTAGGFTKMSFGTMTLGAANAYTGTTTIGNGFLVTDFSQAGAPASNIINSSSPLTLGGSTAGLGDTSYAELFVKGNASTVNTQSFNGTTIALGPAVITATSGTGGSANINLGSLTDTVGGVVVFATPASGNFNTTATNTNGILGGWAVIGTTTTGNNARNGVIQGTNLATVNGSGNIVAYTGYTDYGTAVAGDTGGLIPAGTALHGNVTAATNLRINSNNGASNTFVDTDSAGTTTDVNTISMINTASGASINIGTGNTLRFGTYGTIFRQDIASNATIYIGGTTAGGNQTGNGTVGSQGVGTITAGGPVAGTPGQLVFTVDSNSETSGSLVVEPTIVDNAGGAVTIVKTGPGSMKLDGHNTFSGGLDILQGRLQFAGSEVGTPNPDGGGTGPIRVFPGGQWFPSGAGSTTSPQTINNPIFLAGIGANADDTGAIRATQGLTLAGTITLFGNARMGGGAPTGGTGDFVDPVTGANDPGFLISGQITGNFSMDFGASGNAGGNGTAIWINNPANNWTGNTTILGRTGSTAGNSTLHLSAPNVIPTGVGFGNVVMGFTGDTSTSEVITLDLDGNNQTINGLATGSGSISAQLFVENDLFYYPVGSNGNTVPAPTGVATAPTQATLTLGNNNQTATFSGIIRDTTATPTTLTGTVGGVSYNYIQTGNTVAVVKIGNGVQTFSGANSYSGNTTINGGAISVTGSLLSTGNVLVNTSASGHGALFGTGSVGNVTLAASTGGNNAVINPGATGVGSVGTLTAASVTVNTGGDLEFDMVAPGASDSLNVSGALSFAGASTITPGGGGSTGTYTLITAGSITGAEPALVSPTNTRSVFSYDPNSWNPTTNPTATSIVIDIVTHAANLVWTGQGDGTTWDVDITKNWFNSGTSAGDFFFNGDNVTFDDTGSPNYTVNLPGNSVAPNSITLNNTSGTYSITGTGSITGATGIVKNGTGTVNIGTPNTFTGAVAINAGRIAVSTFSALGANSTSGTTIASGAALDISGDVTVNDVGFGSMPFTIAGTGTDGNGVIVNNGVTQQNAFSSITLSADATVGGSARMDIRSTTSTLNLNNHTLTKVGVNQFSLVNTNISAGSIIVNAGELSIEGTSNAGDDGRFIVLNTGATLQFFGLTGGFSKALEVNGTGVTIGSNVGAGVSESVGSNILLNDPVTIGTLGGSGTLQLTGTISEAGGPQSVTKTGANVLFLQGSSTYSGGTTVSAGTLELGNNTNSGTTITSGPVGLGTLTLANGVTLEDDGNSRVLANNISIGGNVTFDPTTGGGGITLDGTALATPATVTLTASPVLTLNTGVLVNDAIVGGANSLTVATAAGAGVADTLALGSPNNAWSGATTIRSGVLQLRATGALPSGTALTLGNSTTSGTLDLWGSNATVGSLTTAGTGTTNTIGNGGTSSNSTLTFAGGSSTFSGSIVNQLPGGNMNTALAVSSGSLTLTGANTYQGGTTIGSSATLTLGSTGALPSGTAVANNGVLAVNATTAAGNVSGTGQTTVAAATSLTATNFTQGAGLVNNGSTQITGNGSIGGVTGAGTLIVGNGSTGNVVQLAVNSHGSTQSALVINSGAALDITNNHIFITYGSGPDPITAIQGYLDSGYNSGTWTGAGIDSSTAAATSGSYGIGYANSADPGNPAGLSSGTIEIAYTLLGDADLNDIVNGIDFGVVAANFNKGVTSWDQGDFDYNNIVNGIDFGDIAANFNKGASGADAWAAVVQFAEANGLMADVPEPASVALALGAVGFLAARRRRR